jgi:hypothetical protein
MAKRNIFKEAKAYRKAHPRADWQECIAKVSGKKVAGVRKTKRKIQAVGSIAHRVPASKRKRATIKRLSVVKGTKPVSRLQRGTAIIGKIAGMEKKYSKTLDKDKRYLLASEINLLHDKLDQLKKAYKR